MNSTHGQTESTQADFKACSNCPITLRVSVTFLIPLLSPRNQKRFRTYRRAVRTKINWNETDRTYVKRAYDVGYVLDM